MSDKSKLPFWKTKNMAEMSPSEWESLCDSCGKCCCIRLEDDVQRFARHYPWSRHERARRRDKRGISNRGRANHTHRDMARRTRYWVRVACKLSMVSFRLMAKSWRNPCLIISP